MLERSNLGGLLNEFTLAYNLGDPQAARKSSAWASSRATKYVVKFDILKTEQIAQRNRVSTAARSARWPGLLGAFSGSLGGARAGAVGGTAVGSVHQSESTGVWLIGMRYKIINAETTEQVAQGYTEEKMEVGATSSGARRIQSQQGGVGLDTMVQRLVQKSVWEIDSKYK